MVPSLSPWSTSSRQTRHTGTMDVCVVGRIVTMTMLLLGTILDCHRCRGCDLQFPLERLNIKVGRKKVLTVLVVMIIDILSIDEPCYKQRCIITDPRLGFLGSVARHSTLGKVDKIFSWRLLLFLDEEPLGNATGSDDAVACYVAFFGARGTHALNLLIKTSYRTSRAMMAKRTGNRN